MRATLPLLAAAACALCPAACGGARSMPLDLAAMGERVLVITAHPDDAEMYAGGLMFALSHTAKARVALLIATTGDAGGVCANATAPCSREQLAYERAQEAAAGAALLGVDVARDLYNLGFHDGSLTRNHDAAVEGFAAYARAFQPTSVISFFQQPDWAAPPMRGSFPFAWGDLGYHPDHQACGAFAFEAINGPACWTKNALHRSSCKPLPNLKLPDAIRPQPRF